MQTGLGGWGARRAAGVIVHRGQVMKRGRANGRADALPTRTAYVPDTLASILWNRVLLLDATVSQRGISMRHASCVGPAVGGWVRRAVWPASCELRVSVYVTPYVRNGLVCKLGRRFGFCRLG